MTIRRQGEPIADWSTFLSVVQAFKGKWLFRGVLDNWSFEPSLERLCDRWSIRFSERPNVERSLLREFKRAYPTSVATAPPQDADDEWLALMQHHGAPTRLLDWTYSPFVAAFFALNLLLPTEDQERAAAVWALSIDPFEKAFAEPKVPLIPRARLKKRFLEYSKERSGPAFRDVFLQAKPRVAFVNPVSPFRLSQRQVAQQGVFLCPGDVAKSFESNLRAVPGAVARQNLRKLILPRTLLLEAFARLHRMNVNETTLFPGLDGFARSLRHRLPFLASKEVYRFTRY